MVNLSILAAAVLLSVVLQQVHPTLAQPPPCDMSIWVFETFAQCDNPSNPPSAVGTIYADNQCRTIDTEASPTSAAYALFPGTYRAECTGDGKIRLAESGCIDSTCSATAAEDVCDRDNSTVASLYSRLEPPIFSLQSPELATPGALYTCLRLLGSGVNVTFVVFGDCSEPGCSVDGVLNPVPAPPPTDPPTMEAPVESPITDPPTDEPTFNPTPAPAETPTTPLAVPTRTPVEPTSEPTASTPTSPDNGNAISDKIVGVGLRYVPMESTLPPGANDETGLSLWEFVTTKQIRDQSEASGITVVNITLSNVSQNLLPSAASNRVLQQDEEQSLEIFFDLEMTYSRADPPPPTLDVIFWDAFNTEADRTNYLLKLNRADDPDFDALRIVSIASNGEDVQPATSGCARSRFFIHRIWQF